MMDFSKLLDGGGYSFHFLIKLSSSSSDTELYYCNNNTDITYDGNTYHAMLFKYTKNADEYGINGGGVLDISCVDNNGTMNDIIDIVRLNRTLRLDVIAIVNESGEIEGLDNFIHSYCNVEVEGYRARFTFIHDDRLDMKFPSLVFNQINNSGNA